MSANLKVGNFTAKETRAFRDAGFDEAAIIRQADQLRGEVVATMFGRLGRRIRAVAHRIAGAIEQARTMEALSKLDDRTLADIGISRSDIPGYALRVRDAEEREAVAPDPAPATDEARKAA